MKPSLTLSREDQTRTVLNYVTFMPVESRTEMSIAGKDQHVNFLGRLGIGEPETFTHALKECLNKKKTKTQYLQTSGAGASYQTSHPGISARAIAFGRSWPFAAFCYRPCLPVRH